MKRKFIVFYLDKKRKQKTIVLKSLNEKALKKQCRLLDIKNYYFTQLIV